MRDRAKSVVAGVIITAIFLVLVFPIPEMDATARCRVIAIDLPTSFVIHLPSQLLMAARDASPYSQIEDGLELLTVLCVRNC
jgi:hypothetical protein